MEVIKENIQAQKSLYIKELMPLFALNQLKIALH